jgi:predicted nucleic acid-binding protein
MANPKRPYWDAVVFLDLGGNYNPPEDADYIARLKAMWSESEKGLFQIVTSALTIAEVLWLRNQPRPSPAAEKLIRSFFESPNVLLVDVTRVVAEAARDLVWQGLRPKDAIHVASALDARCDVLYTRDGPMCGRNGQVGGSPALRIESPSSYTFAQQTTIPGTG